MHLSIVQVATSSHRLADRVVVRHEQVKTHPPRTAREIGLALLRGRAEIGHAAWAALGPFAAQEAASQMESIRSAEATRDSQLVAAADGVAVITSLVLTEQTFLPSLGADVAGGLEASLRSLSELPDAWVQGFVLLRAPADPTQGIHAEEVGRTYPHLRTVDAATLSGQVRCRFCGTLFAFSSTRCPSCGGDVQK